jgi:hypothetical protein
MRRLPEEPGQSPRTRGVRSARNQSGFAESVYGACESQLAQRPLQGAFLIPPVPPVVLIGSRWQSMAVFGKVSVRVASRDAIDNEFFR